MNVIARAFLTCLVLMPLMSCVNDNISNTPTVPEPRDTHSFADPDVARTVHVDFDIDVDFDTRIISGTARHMIEHDGASEFIFDSKGLNILKITINDGDEDINFSFTEEDPIKGKGVIVPISKIVRSITVYFFTDPEAAALGWLTPEQTANKTSPFLYTQGQAILTRTWLPVQDSPGIRFSYDATVRVPEGMLAVMSASNPTEKSEDGVYEFAMPQPIPAYLIALAVGDIEFASVGERTGVYAEPALLEASKEEFSQMEEMLVAAEELYGDYDWDRYDLIILPPSFPFGGMENPRLTFATPTIIAGDKSLVSLVAHELAHSWSGNLVTNRTWNDFWLNEGFTVYFERRIMEEVYGEEYTRMLTMLGKQDLEDEVKDLGPESADTHLKLHLEGRDPDDGMTDIAYEKGAFFLTLLEQKVGRKVFDKFLRKYFSENKFKSMSTEAFVVYLNDNFIVPNKVDVYIDDWIYGPGIPDNCPVVESNKFELVDNLISTMQPDGDVPEIPAGWTTHEWLHFIRNLPKDYTASDMANMDAQYALYNSGNSEIAAAWYEQAIERGYSNEIAPSIREFLVSVGRRKFLTPLYKAYKESDQLETARDIYAEARPNYHAVSTATLDELLDISIDN